MLLKHELVGDRQQQIKNYRQAVQKQVQEEGEELIQMVINELNEYVKDNGCQIIFGG